MNVVISKECAKQIRIIRYLKNKGNSDFEKLYTRIGLCIKALESVNCIDDIPFELRFHEGNQDKIGYLGDPLEKCLSVDLDGTSRFLTFEKKGNAIVLTSIGHYKISLGKDNNGNDLWLFDHPEKQFKYIDSMSDQRFEELKRSGEHTKQVLMNFVRNIQIDDFSIHAFDSNLKKDICPINPDSVKCRLSSSLSKWEDQYKQDNNISKLRASDSKIRDAEVGRFIDKYTSVLKRAIVNARGLSNAGAVVCGDKDPNKIAELKIMLDECWVKHFANLIYYVNTKVSSVAVKKESFNKMGNALLKGFDKKYDRIVEVDNEELRKLDENLRKAVFEDINNVLSLQPKKYMQTIKNTNQQSIFNRLFPKFTVAVQNLKSIFSGKGQTNEADSSVESVAFPKEPKENITKTETIAESLGNQSLNNQEPSLSSRRAFMNEQIQVKAEADASKEVNQASAVSPRMAMMQRNKERNNVRDNVISKTRNVKSR